MRSYTGKSGKGSAIAADNSGKPGGKNHPGMGICKTMNIYSVCTSEYSFRQIREILANNDLLKCDYAPDVNVDSVTYFATVEKESLVYNVYSSLDPRPVCAHRAVKLKVHSKNDNVQFNINIAVSNWIVIICATLCLGIFPFISEIFFSQDGLDAQGLFFCICWFGIYPL